MNPVWSKSLPHWKAQFAKSAPLVYDVPVLTPHLCRWRRSQDAECIRVRFGIIPFVVHLIAEHIRDAVCCCHGCSLRISCGLAAAITVAGILFPGRPIWGYCQKDTSGVPKTCFACGI